MGWKGVAIGAVFLGSAMPASAHVAFSSLDVRIQGSAVEVTVVAQAIDLAHDLGIDPPERLLDLPFLVREQSAIGRLLESELSISSRGNTASAAEWSPAVAPDQQLIRMRTHYDVGGAPGRITIASRLFAYDSAHQTLVNVYEQDALTTQQILDAGRVELEYFTGTRTGFASLLEWFSRAGLQRALSGYSYLLFAIALVLPGGSPRRLGIILGAFILSCSAGLALGVSNAVAIPAAAVMPAVALSIVYAGVDNVMVRGQRDVRVWTALGFGWAHGLAFASTFGALDRPVRSVVWAVASFGAGTAAGLLLVSAAAASLSAFAIGHGKRNLAVAGSIAIAAIGVVSFIQRVVWPGGLR